MDALLGQSCLWASLWPFLDGQLCSLLTYLFPVTCSLGHKYSLQCALYDGEEGSEEL